MKKVSLSVLGLLLFSIVWSMASYMTSEYNIVLSDKSKPLDERYLQDSVRASKYDHLFHMSKDSLSFYGLERKRYAKTIPSIYNIGVGIYEMYEENDLVDNFFISITINVLGYLVAISLSLIIGLSLSYDETLKRIFEPIINSSRFIPLSALTGIFILWFGLGFVMKTMFLAVGIMVYMIPSILTTANEVKVEYLQMAKTLNASRWQIFRTVTIPTIISYFITDIRVLTAISWTYILIAEIINTQGGLGYLIWVSRRQGRIDKAFGLLILIIVFGIVQDILLKKLDKVINKYKYS